MSQRVSEAIPPINSYMFEPDNIGAKDVAAQIAATHEDKRFTEVLLPSDSHISPTLAALRELRGIVAHRQGRRREDPGMLVLPASLFDTTHYSLQEHDSLYGFIRSWERLGSLPESKLIAIVREQSDIEVNMHEGSPLNFLLLNALNNPETNANIAFMSAGTRIRGLGRFARRASIGISVDSLPGPTEMISTSLYNPRTHGIAGLENTPIAIPGLTAELIEDFKSKIGSVAVGCSFLTAN